MGFRAPHQPGHQATPASSAASPFSRCFHRTRAGSTPAGSQAFVSQKRRKSHVQCRLAPPAIGREGERREPQTHRAGNRQGAPIRRCPGPAGQAVWASRAPRSWPRLARPGEPRPPVARISTLLASSCCRSQGLPAASRKQAGAVHNGCAWTREPWRPRPAAAHPFAPPANNIPARSA